MAEGWAVGQANAVLDALTKAASVFDIDAVWIQLHVGAPGAAGTANVAAETDRIQATFGDAAASGAVSNTVALTWTGVAGAEDYTHFTAWTASTAGTFLFSGTVTANAVAINDTFTIPVGDLDLSMPTAS